MSNQVYANNMEVSCKAADGKSICAFPDVCFTPPTTPATPPGVPIPYPNTGMATDTTAGSTSVQISGKEVMLKNKSYFKRSMGDEAGCAPKKGVVTSQNMGKVYFTAWSMDVKVEGENVVRMMDLTTHNHASAPGQTPPMLYQDLIAFGDPVACMGDSNKANTACAGCSTDTCTQDCRDAQACLLVAKKDAKDKCCKPNTTGDHLIEDHWVRPKGTLMPDFAHLADKPGGAYHGAPTACVNRSRYEDKHGIGHGTRGVYEDKFFKGGTFSYLEAKAMARESHQHANSNRCSEHCLDAQLDAFYGKGDERQLQASNQNQALTVDQRSAARARTGVDSWP